MKDVMYHDYKVGESVYTPDGQLRKITSVTNLSIVLENIGNIGVYTKTFPLLKLSEYDKAFRKLQKYKKDIASGNIILIKCNLPTKDNVPLNKAIHPQM